MQSRSSATECWIRLPVRQSHCGLGDDPVATIEGIPHRPCTPSHSVALLKRWSLPLGSQPADPRSTTVGTETCSTPVLNHSRQGMLTHPDRVFATSTKICTRGHSALGHPRATPQAPASSYAPAPCPAAAAAACCEAMAVRWLGRHPFSELLASAGELLHTPKRVPTFMATALLSLAGNVLCGI